MSDTERLSYYDLGKSLSILKGRLKLPAHYRHTKSGGIYVAFAVSFNEADMTPLVTYYPLMSDWTLFSRPLQDFNEKFTFVKYIGPDPDIPM
jgi:hypothetical protein